TPKEIPVPIYPLVPMLKPQASLRALAGKFAFCDQVEVVVLYSHKSSRGLPSSPVAIYPFVPMVNPTASVLGLKPTDGFCVHVFGESVSPNVIGSEFIDPISTGSELITLIL